MKQTIRSNHRIVVAPSSYVDTRYGVLVAGARVGTVEYSNAMDERCEEMRRSILRHVDGLARDSGNGRPAPGAVRIEADSRDECSFCGRFWEELTQEMVDAEGLMYWTEDEDNIDVNGPGLPMCCGAAQDEWRSEKRAATRVEK